MLGCEGGEIESGLTGPAAGGSAGQAGSASAGTAGTAGTGGGAAGKSGGAGTAGASGGGQGGGAGKAGQGGSAGAAGVAGSAGAAGGSGTAGAAGVAGQGGSGGQGGNAGVQCANVGECTQPSDPCAEAICDGICKTQPKAAATVLAVQAAGDCKRNECDGLGAVVSVNDDADAPAPVSSCEQTVCAAGLVVRTPVALGTACTDGGGKVCDGVDACVACNVPADCATGACQDNVCVAPPCVNGVQDNGETDIDCGGTCGPCAPTQKCTGPADCTSGVCTDGICAASSCTDTVKNGDETGVDCGGVCVKGCADGDPCKTPDDCASLVCNGGVCAPASCTDVVKNGDEADVDCGGSCPKKCDPDDSCLGPADCASGVCTAGICVAPSCSDTVKNADETGVDCGGPTCKACDPGGGCSVPSDCLSGVCTDGLCVAPSCSDTVKNGDESDVDCGGACPTKCTQDEGCNGPADCISGVCTGGTCQAPGCSDSVQNGGETGVDCGGPCAKTCDLGGGCADTDDCSGSLTCKDGTCQQLFPTAGLVGAWNLDGAGPTIADRSGNANDGATATAGASTAGKVGNALVFDGTQCVGVPDSASLSLVGGSAVTMMAWVRVDDADCEFDRGMILNKENTYEHGYECGAPGAASVRYQEAIQTSSGGWFWTGTSTVAVGTWHHVVTTWNGAVVTRYIDGAAVAEVPRILTGAFADRATGLGIGCRSIGASGSFPSGTSISRFIGAIDEAAVYARALTPDEIAAYYDATK